MSSSDPTQVLSDVAGLFGVGVFKDLSERTRNRYNPLRTSIRVTVTFIIVYHIRFRETQNQTLLPYDVIN